MDELPGIDPNWVRRKRTTEMSDPTNTIAVVMLVLIAALAFAVLRHYAHESEAIEQARLAVQASQEQQRVAAEREQARYQAFRSVQAQGLPGVFADQAELGSRSSIAGKVIHRCSSGGFSTYQAQPCQAPEQEIGGEYSSRQQRAYDDALMRQQADAKLRQEQARWNAAIGSQPQFAPSNPGIVSDVDRRRTNCANAKGDRDDAYERAGARRSFDMIRRWTDIVFEACKE